MVYSARVKNFSPIALRVELLQVHGAAAVLPLPTPGPGPGLRGKAGALLLMTSRRLVQSLHRYDSDGPLDHSTLGQPGP
jgi:hypothetical protein